MKKISEYYLLVEMNSNGEDYTICNDEGGDHIVRQDMQSILEAVDDAVENYAGKTLTIIKETVKIIDTVYVPEI